MKAWVLHKPGPLKKSPLRLRKFPMPKPGLRQIRIRITACGICHTDLHIVEGELALPKLPLIIGHQIVGVVEALGSYARGHRVGERVGVPWLHAVCGHCKYCKERQENLCQSAQFTGYHVNGGYAEFAVIADQAAYPLPRRYSDVEAAPLLCAGVIGFRALKLSGVRSGCRLGLYGFGASAHLTLQVARRLGCTVYVFSRSSEHRHLARKLGAAWTGSADKNPPELLDSAIIFAPAGELVPKALGHLRRGGTLALAGITMSPIPRLDYGLLSGEKHVVSVANSTRADVREFLRLAGRIPLKVEVERFPFAQAEEALTQLKAGRIHGAGVLTLARLR